MDNIKIYYLEDEYEPQIVMIDQSKKEAYEINSLDLTAISKIEYPSNDVLNNIIKKAVSEGYGGDISDIKSILDDPQIIEGLIKSSNRDEYILSIKENKKDTNNLVNPTEILIERFWERFENLSYAISRKYKPIYDKVVKYLKSLNEEESKLLLSLTEKLSEKDFFFHLLTKVGISDKINTHHFDF